MTFTASREPGDAASGAAQLSRVSLLVAFLLNGLFAVFGFLLLPPLFGDGFAGARWPFVILLLSTTALGGYVVVGGYLSGAGHPLVLSTVLFIPALANVALSILLIPPFGLVGNAWASSSTSLVVLAASLFAFSRIAGLPIGRAVLPERGDLRRAIDLLTRR